MKKSIEQLAEEAYPSNKSLDWDPMAAQLQAAYIAGANQQKVLQQEANLLNELLNGEVALKYNLKDQQRDVNLCEYIIIGLLPVIFVTMYLYFISLLENLMRSSGN